MSLDFDFSLVLEQHPHPVIVANPDTLAVLWFNDAAQAWLPPSSAIMEGIPITQSLSCTLPLLPYFQSVIDGQAYAHVRDADFASNPNERKTADCLIYSVDAGLVCMLMPHKIDPTMSDRGGELAAVSSLGRMLAHELKNPLAGISGAAQLIRSEPVSEDITALTDMIVDEVGRLGRMVSKIETLGRVSTDKFAPINIHTVLRDAQGMFVNQREFPFQFHEDYDPSLPDIMGDRDQLLQVFSNLFANAASAMQNAGQGDQIKLVSAYRAGIKKKLKSGETHNVPVEIRVIDNGPGIAPELQNRVFEPFVTSKPTGQGLGLSLVSRIIDGHNGLIEFKSEPNFTEFVLRFPSGHGAQ